MDDYYERYWGRDLEGDGIATSPPVWEEKNLLRIESAIKPYIRGKVLDVGCGDGYLAFNLSKFDKVQEAIGVDISPTAVAQAKKEYPGIQFKVAPATKLPFPKESFDSIVAIELVEHVLDVEQMFREFNRVLKQKGKLFITTTDFNLLKKITIALIFWEKYFYPTNPHIRFFTKSTLRDVLRKMGFRIVKYEWNGSYAGIMPKGQIVVAEKEKIVVK